MPPTPPLKVAIVQRIIRSKLLTLVLIPMDKTSTTLPRNRGTMQTSCQIYLLLLNLPAFPTLKQMLRTLLNHSWPRLNCKLPFPIRTRGTLLRPSITMPTQTRSVSTWEPGNQIFNKYHPVSPHRPKKSPSKLVTSATKAHPALSLPPQSSTAFLFPPICASRLLSPYLSTP